MAEEEHQESSWELEEDTPQPDKQQNTGKKDRVLLSEDPRLNDSSLFPLMKLNC